MAERNTELIRAVRIGDLESARRIQERLLPFVDAVMRTSQGAIVAKAALRHLGIIEDAAVRLPLLESPSEDLRRLEEALTAVGTYGTPMETYMTVPPTAVRDPGLL